MRKIVVSFEIVFEILKKKSETHDAPLDSVGGTGIVDDDDDDEFRSMLSIFLSLSLSQNLQNLRKYLSQPVRKFGETENFFEGGYSLFFLSLSVQILANTKINKKLYK